MKDLGEFVIALDPVDKKEGIQGFLKELHIQPDLLSVFEQIDGPGKDQSQC